MTRREERWPQAIFLEPTPALADRKETPFLNRIVPRRLKGANTARRGPAGALFGAGAGHPRCTPGAPPGRIPKNANFRRPLQLIEDIR